ncbi:MAG: glycosyltransferase [Bryobacterales bacterium]|nr:glycosyltransferase [Bryobacterales bacterium]
MKILWVNPNLLHPTTKGGQIRTLEMLRRLHRRHEIHYATLGDAADEEGLRRSSEYCSRIDQVLHRIPHRYSPAFAAQLAAGLFSPLPVAIARYRSEALRRLLEQRIALERYDSVVCDFLVSAASMPALERAVLLQHNVETLIWRRHAEHAGNPASRLYLGWQARRMFRYERDVCRSCRRVIAVSGADAALMGSLFGLSGVPDIPTGVDVDYFAPPPDVAPVSDLVFLGSMDWLPNIDGVRYFCTAILPLIRRRLPQCSLTIAGRLPPPEIRSLAEQDPLIRVTGTVKDIRPYLWGSTVSVVPLRIGGGTRLKIYESMAAGVPVVSTGVGAEGLACRNGVDILIEDDPGAFAEACAGLLQDASRRGSIASAAREMVAGSYSWDRVAARLESLLSDSAA